MTASMITLLHALKCKDPTLWHMMVVSSLLVIVMLLTLCMCKKISKETTGDMMLITVLLWMNPKALKNKLHTQTPNTQKSIEPVPLLLTVTIRLKLSTYVLVDWLWSSKPIILAIIFIVLYEKHKNTVKANIYIPKVSITGLIWNLLCIKPLMKSSIISIVWNPSL